MEGIRMKKLALAVVALTVIFICSALMNFGTFKIPQSGWKPLGDASFYVDLGESRGVRCVYVFLSDEQRVCFDLYAGAPGSWKRVGKLDKSGDFCSWEKVNVRRETRFLKFEFQDSAGEIGEILVVSDDGKKIGVQAIISLNETNESLSHLIDEQDVATPPITQKYGTYFDEIYFVRTAWEHLHFEEPFEWTHPPLSKLIIAFGILSFGMCSFAWRFPGLLAAAALIPLMFFFGRRLFGSSFAGLLCAFLITFDFMHFTMARLATGEIFILFFTTLMFFLFFQYFDEAFERGGGDVVAAHGSLSKSALRSLFLSVIVFGLAFSTKWNTAYGFAAVLVLLVLTLLKGAFGREVTFTVVAGLLVAALIYVLSYVPYMLAGHGFYDVLRLQHSMYVYHATLTATHPFSSPWWSWWLMTKPLWLYFNDLNGKVSTIVCMGNPMIWWASIPFMIMTLIRLVRSRFSDKVSVFITIPFFLQWLPYAFISRCLFIYHFISNIPFMIFATVYWLNWLCVGPSHPSLRRLGKVFVAAFLIAVVAFFVTFYPIISGIPVSPEYREALRWFEYKEETKAWLGWVFVSIPLRSYFRHLLPTI